RAPEVAEAIAAGVIAAGGEVDVCPVADGGEGTAAAVCGALGGTVRWTTAHDPLRNPIEASFVLVEGGRTAVVDTAAASGLPLVDPVERDAETASTYGTGELIAAALDAGARRVLLAAGGSATTDGGLGAIAALRERGGIGDASLEVLCDVRTPFEEAARVFAPQKGADAPTVTKLEARLERIAEELPRDPRGLAMSGCAGGLSGGLWAAFGAHLRPGAEYVLDLLDFAARLRRADAVVTGEGRLDSQSLEGKVVGEIAQACAAAGRDLHIVVGRNDLGNGSMTDLSVRSVREAGTRREMTAAGREIAAEMLVSRRRRGSHGRPAG
ncbi:MAG TPA: glycerate kinase, partial [Solirubrobacterales bacterium]|nr:glycerate kinase [Solirubrobacterales bacterium]